MGWHEIDPVVKSQVEYHINQIKTTGTKTLVFWPLKKSPNAVTNNYRLRVLAGLLGAAEFSGMGPTKKLDALMIKAREHGYTFIDHIEVYDNA